MCLIAVALRVHPRYPLVIAANRDEFHARPTAPAAYWGVGGVTAADDVFGGRDLRAGGSWLAVRADGRWAAVTNVREPSVPSADTTAELCSRGALVADFVKGLLPVESFAQSVRAAADRHAGFNLLFGTPDQLYYASNRPAPGQLSRLDGGVHAVSNASLDTPWPKLLRLRRQLADWCALGETDPTPLWQALADDRPAADEALPQTGVGQDLERMLSPVFIRSAHYGTRASTLVLRAADSQWTFVERRWGANGQAQGETCQQWVEHRS